MRIESDNYDILFSGKKRGILYFLIFVFTTICIIRNIYVGYTNQVLLGIITIFFLSQFIRWFFFSCEVKGNDIRIKELGKTTCFTKDSICGIYNMDFFGTLIEYERDKRVLIPSSKRVFLEKCSNNHFYFSQDVLMAKARKRGFILVRPNWMGILFRALFLYLFVGASLKIIIEGHTALQHESISASFVFDLIMILAFVLACILWVNASFTFINEEYIWQGLIFPRFRHKWDEVAYYIEDKHSVRGFTIHTVSLYFKDFSKFRIKTSIKTNMLNAEDLMFLIHLNNIQFGHTKDIKEVKERTKKVTDIFDVIGRLAPLGKEVLVYPLIILLFGIFPYFMYQSLTMSMLVGFIGAVILCFVSMGIISKENDELYQQIKVKTLFEEEFIIYGIIAINMQLFFLYHRIDICIEMTAFIVGIRLIKILWVMNKIKKGRYGYYMNGAVNTGLIFASSSAGALFYRNFNTESMSVSNFTILLLICTFIIEILIVVFCVDPTVAFIIKFWERKTN